MPEYVMTHYFAAYSRQLIDSILAVRVGFEPTEPVKVQRFSRPPDSTTLAPHRSVFIVPTPCSGHPCREVQGGIAAPEPYNGESGLPTGVWNANSSCSAPMGR